MNNTIIIHAPDGNITITSNHPIEEDGTNQIRNFYVYPNYTITPPMAGGRVINPAVPGGNIDVTVNGLLHHAEAVTINFNADRVVVSLR